MAICLSAAVSNTLCLFPGFSLLYLCGFIWIFIWQMVQTQVSAAMLLNIL